MYFDPLCLHFFVKLHCLALLLVQYQMAVCCFFFLRAQTIKIKIAFPGVFFNFWVPSGRIKVCFLMVLVLWSPGAPPVCWELPFGLSPISGCSVQSFRFGSRLGHSKISDLVLVLVEPFRYLHEKWEHSSATVRSVSSVLSVLHWLAHLGSCGPVARSGSRLRFPRGSHLK